MLAQEELETAAGLRLSSLVTYPCGDWGRPVLETVGRSRGLTTGSGILGASE